MDEFKYKDILNYNYPNPEIEKDFPDKILREAQFAPFAALTGHDEAILETARLTDKKIEIDDYEKENLDRKLKYIIEHCDDKDIFSVTYFLPDKKKEGGRYVTVTDTILKIKTYENTLLMNNKTEIPIRDILMLDGDVFASIGIE